VPSPPLWVEEPCATTQAGTNCLGSSSVGKALRVPMVSERDMGQQRVLAATMANSSLDCMNSSRAKG